MKTDFELTQDVSCEFNRILSEWLTVDEIDEVIRRNKTDEYDGICATHDFCDSNVAMDEAFSKIMGYNASDKLLTDERTITIWNAAWNLSKGKSFGRKQTLPTFRQFILSRTPMPPTEQTADTLSMSGDFHPDQCETIFSYMNNRCYLVQLKSDRRFGVLLGIDEHYSENIIDIERELYGWYIDEFHS